MINFKIVTRIGALVVPLLAWGASGTDGVNVTVARGPAAGEVSLSWVGGTAPFDVYRSTSPADVETALSFVGTSQTASYVDTPPAGQSFYYFVKPGCNYNPPETCNGIDDDCDGSVDEGFIADTNPACVNYVNLGSLPGDIGTGALFYSGTTEAWLRVNLTETSSGEYNLTAGIFLNSPAGSDFDLYVRCLGCSGATGAWSFEHTMESHLDSAFIRRNDTDRIDTFPVLIEIRSFAQTSCGTWQLTIIGNAGATYETCANP